VTMRFFFLLALGLMIVDELISDQIYHWFSWRPPDILGGIVTWLSHLF
jgi:hypothetical protein